MNQNKLKKEPFIYDFKVFIFFVAFTILIFVAVLFVKNLNHQQYVFLRIGISICIAGIGATLPGFLKISYKKVISAGGALAIFIVVYLLEPGISGISPDNDSYNLIVQVRDLNNRENTFSGESVIVMVGDNLPLGPKELNSDGQQTFAAIPPKHANDTVFLLFKNNRIVVANSHKTLKDAASGILLFYAEVLKDTTLVYGTVDFNGKLAIGYTVSFKDHSTSSDSLGRYRLLLPFSEGTPIKPIIFYNSKKYIQDYRSITSSQPIDFWIND